MLRSALSPLRLVGWRAVAVAAVVAAVYAAAMFGNGFWGYAAASEISSGACTTSTTGQETCVTRFCQDGTGGRTQCTTYTTVCEPADTRGQRRCATTSEESSCGSDKSECQPIGDPGTCTTSSGGFEHCWSRSCSADGDRVTCIRTDVYCNPPGPNPPPTSGTVYTPPRCFSTQSQVTCTSAPDSCGYNTGGMQGKVLEGDRTPIPDATVEVLTRTGALVAEAGTRPDGTFIVSDLPPADYRVRFRAGGFRSEFYDDRRTLEASDPVPVRVRSRPRLVARLAPGNGRIEGLVAGVGPERIAGATVTVFDDDGDVVTTATSAGPKGKYQTGLLPVGDYRLRFEAPDFETEFFDDAATLAGADPVAVEHGQTAKATARLQPSP